MSTKNIETVPYKFNLKWIANSMFCLKSFVVVKKTTKGLSKVAALIRFKTIGLASLS